MVILNHQLRAHLVFLIIPIKLYFYDFNSPKILECVIYIALFIFLEFIKLVVIP